MPTGSSSAQVGPGVDDVQSMGAQTSQARRSPKFQAGRFLQAQWGHLVLVRHGQVKLGAAQTQPKLAPENLQLWSGELLVLLKPLPHEVARGCSCNRAGCSSASPETRRRHHRRLVLRGRCSISKRLGTGTLDTRKQGHRQPKPPPHARCCKTIEPQHP